MDFFLDGDLPDNCHSVTEDMVLAMMAELRRRAEMFARVCFPMVRQVLPMLIANEIVSVQPMTMPSAPSFFEMSYVYNAYKGA